MAARSEATPTTPDTPPPVTPPWLLALEQKRQRVHRLAHDVGAGSPCLLCKDSCPGLDLHFWRKLCKNCKCKKEDHDVVDDGGFEQFEILLGSDSCRSRQKKTFLDILEKQTSAGAKRIAFDWIPPNASPDLAAEYMQALPSDKLPISGSDGALYRRQQLERQLPLHDLDANQCHQLTDTEITNLKDYLQNLKNNVVGQGQITKLTVPTSHSANAIYSSIPKPFQSTPFSTPYKTEEIVRPPSQSDFISQGYHLKPPSAFLPKGSGSSRGSSPAFSDQEEAPSVCLKCSVPTDVAHSCAIHTAHPSLSSEYQTRGHEGNFQRNVYPDQINIHQYSESEAPIKQSTSDDNSNIIYPRNTKPIDGKLISYQVPESVAQTSSVPGNMWVPADCPVCSQKPATGKLISTGTCTHVAQSIDLMPETSIAKPLGRATSPAVGESGFNRNASPDSCKLTHHYPEQPFHPNSDDNGNNINPSEFLAKSGVCQATESQLAPGQFAASRDISPFRSGVTPSSGTPHLITQYAINASILDPQDVLSPHMASLQLDNSTVQPFDNSINNKTWPDNIQEEVAPQPDLHCAQCQETIFPGEVVVCAERAGAGVVWHPKCFVCSTCQELLVDLVYFFKKGKVYCGRHFAELLNIPRCSACDELIFVKEHTVAEGQTFHIKHFCCFECDEPLAGKQYIPKDGQPVCLPCYEKKYGKKCETCCTLIGATDQQVIWKNLHWHAREDCFVCNQCHISLLGSRFVVKEQRPFCSKECVQKAFAV